MSKRKITEEMAQQIERESEDPELWAKEPVQIEARPSRSSVLSLRLPTAEFHTLLKAAQDANQSVSEYVRNAIALRQKQEAATSHYSVTYTETAAPKRTETLQWSNYTAGGVEVRTTEPSGDEAR